MNILNKIYIFAMSQNKLTRIVVVGIILWISFFIVSGALSFFSESFSDTDALIGGIGGGLVMIFILLRSKIFYIIKNFIYVLKKIFFRLVRVLLEK